MNDRIAELVGRLANAPQVYMYQRTPKKNGALEVVGSYGFNVQTLPANWHIQELDINPRTSVACRNCSGNSLFDNHPLQQMVPAATAIFAVKIQSQNSHESNPAYMVVVNPEASLFEDDDRMTALMMLAHMLIVCPYGDRLRAQLGPLANGFNSDGADKFALGPFGLKLALPAFAQGQPA